MIIFTRRTRLFLLKLILPLSLIIYLYYELCLTRISTDDYLYKRNYAYEYPSLTRSTSISLPFSVNYLKDLINRINKNEYIRNKQLYGQLRENDTIFVIQVHDRTNYLQSLIYSFKKIKGINKSLLIFSHDVYHPKINSLISKIRFTKVMQIFYPNSLQIYENEFPGHHPNDCPRDIKPEEAKRIKCNNAENPDTYGHYREASYTQTKHHWFWKINYVFDHLKYTRTHNGPFIFLEEDHYATPDLLHMLYQMLDVKSRECPYCDLLTLGLYSKLVNYGRNGNKVIIEKWISSRHNMGMVIDRKAWLKIKKYASKFCTYDDYNWDWSLQYISAKFLSQPLITLAVNAPRVFHVGECGVHHKKKNCSNNGIIERIEKVINLSSKFLFSKNLQVSKVIKKSGIFKVNGGWADVRDHKLCLQNVIT